MPGLCEPGCGEPTGYGQQGFVFASQGASQTHGHFMESQIGLVPSVTGLSRGGHLLLRSGTAVMSWFLGSSVGFDVEREGGGHWITPGLFLFSLDLQRPGRATSVASPP